MAKELAILHFLLPACWQTGSATCPPYSTLAGGKENEALLRHSGYDASATKPASFIFCVPKKRSKKKGNSDESDTTIGVVRPASTKSKIHDQPS